MSLIRNFHNIQNEIFSFVHYRKHEIPPKLWTLYTASGMMHTFHLKPHGIVNPQPARADEFGSSCFTDSDVLPRGCSPEDPGIGEVPYELPEQHSCVCLDISYVLRRICSESYMSKLCYISYVSKLYIPRKLCKNRTKTKLHKLCVTTQVVHLYYMQVRQSCTSG